MKQKKEQELQTGKGTKWLTIPEVAKILNVSAKTIQRWRQIGYGPKVTRQGRLIFYLRERVESFVSTFKAEEVAANRTGGEISASRRPARAQAAATPEVANRPEIPEGNETAPDFMKARARKEQCRALRAEDELKRRRAQLLPVDQIIIAKRMMRTFIKEQMLAIPGALAQDLAMKPPWECELLMRHAIDAALTRAGTHSLGPEDAAEQEPANPPSNELETEPTFMMFRTRRELAEAALQELDYKQRVGQLMPSDEFIAAESYFCVNLKMNLRGIPRKIAPRIAGKAARKCGDLLTKAIQTELERSGEFSFEKIEPAVAACSTGGKNAKKIKK
jgi:hypothetical protein